MRELTNILGADDVKINILSHEIVTLSHTDSTIGHIHLICDMRLYGGSGNPDLGTREREADPDAKLNYLLDNLTIHFWKQREFNKQGDVRFKGHRPQFFATRLRELQNIAHMAREIKLDDAQNRIEVTVKNGVIELEPTLWKKFISGSEPNANGKYTVTVVSDTVERYVKITPLARGKAFVPVEVRHTDKHGQIAAFTSLLWELKANIFSSYLRLEKAYGPATCAACWKSTAAMSKT